MKHQYTVTFANRKQAAGTLHTLRKHFIKYKGLKAAVTSANVWLAGSTIYKATPVDNKVIVTRTYAGKSEPATLATFDHDTLSANFEQMSAEALEITTELLLPYLVGYPDYKA